MKGLMRGQDRGGQRGQHREGGQDKTEKAEAVRLIAARAHAATRALSGVQPPVQEVNREVDE